MTKMYVFVRTDLSKSQQAVQCGHAVAEYLIQYGTKSSNWCNGTLIYLRTPDEFYLKLIVKKFRERGYNIATFYDVFKNSKSELTAIALISSNEDLFKNFQLL